MLEYQTQTINIANKLYVFFIIENNLFAWAIWMYKMEKQTWMNKTHDSESGYELENALLIEFVLLNYTIITDSN